MRLAALGLTLKGRSDGEMEGRAIREKRVLGEVKLKGESGLGKIAYIRERSKIT